MPRFGMHVFVVVLVLLSLSSVTFAYLPGAPVQMLRRIQYGGKRTPWTETMRTHAPQFRRPLQVFLPLDSLEFSPHQPLKISFSFDFTLVETPWIFIVDGQGMFLQSIAFTFTYSGHDIKSVKWETKNIPNQPKEIVLEYLWEELVEEDTLSGLYSMLVFGSVLTAAVVMAVALHMVSAKDENRGSAISDQLEGHRLLSNDDSLDSSVMSGFMGQSQENIQSWPKDMTKSD